ncbi:MAG: site-specific integrase [Anaerolineales bacterium]
MARKRAHNEGCIYFRKERNEWCAQISLNGKRLTRYEKTQRECRDWVRTTLTQIDGGLSMDGLRMTLKQYADSWLENKSLSLRPNTIILYRKTLTQHILPVLGKLILRDIQPTQIKRLYAIKKQEDRGARTIQLIHAVLHCLMKHAVREGILGKNPLDVIERPRTEQAEFQILNEEQCHQFLIAAADSPYEALYYLALTTGMRQGELLGLKWTDLDWNKSVLLVQRQLQRVEHEGVCLVPPKTKAGRRQIKLGQGILEKMKEHRLKQEQIKVATGDRWQENDLVFPSTIGTPLDQYRLSHEFKKLIKNNGLPNIRFHDLRHTSISFLLEMGTPLNTVQRRAGHAKASTTSDVYGHSMARSQEEAAEKIDEMVLPIAVKLQSKESYESKPGG